MYKATLVLLLSLSVAACGDDGDDGDDVDDVGEVTAAIDFPPVLGGLAGSFNFNSETFSLSDGASPPNVLFFHR